MHEQGIVKTLIKQIEAIRRDHQATSVSAVRLQAGPLSGVEPDLLKSAFDLQKQRLKPLAKAALEIEETNLRGRCRRCDMEFEIAAFHFRCPDCESNVELLAGDELMLVSIVCN